jgi:hypothetical protein
MKGKFTIAVGLLGLLLAGCYPQGPEFVNDLDVVLTDHESDFDFSTRQTYAMPDDIVKITGKLAEGDNPEFIPDAVAVQIIGRIESNMADLGYTRVDVDDDPDLLLLPASWETTTIYWWYDYWYWWYGGYWGWYYPPMYASSYTTGTLIWSVVDPEVEAANGNVIRQWRAAINGLLVGTYDAARVNKAIDQAFAQSPYLKTN